MGSSLVNAAALVLAVTVAAGSAQAALIVSGSVGGAPSRVTLDNLDALPLGSGGGVTATGITVSFGGTGRVVQGSLAGIYAAPFLSGGNGTGFGSPNQPNGVNTTRYLTSGSTGANPGSFAQLLFSSPQQYLGLLWGSVDANNRLEFFLGAASVGFVLGSDVTASPNGNQGVNGTLYVNINSTLPFDRVVATRPTYAFEFDNIAYDERPVPAPATLALLGLGFAGVAAARRKRG